MNLQYTVSLETATDFLNFAEQYGLALHEVHAGDKNPVGAGWQHLHSSDSSAWRGWLTAGRNIGLHPGASRIAVLDIEAGKQEIAEAWFLRITGYALPEPHVRTPSGGTHTYFRLADATGLTTLREKDTGWGDLIVGNGNAMCAPSYFANPKNDNHKRAGHYEWLENETLYDGEILRSAWPKRVERAAVAPALDGYRIEEVAWWIDRKTASGEWDLSQLDWTMLGAALKLHFGSAGLELFQRMSHDPDQAAKRFDKFPAEYSESDRTLYWYLERDRDITWMFRHSFGCPRPLLCPVPFPIPAEILEQHKREREQYHAAMLGPLPDHPELPIDQANALTDYWAHLPSGKMIYERTGELFNAGSVDKHIGRVKDAMKTEGPGTLATTWLSQHRFVKSMGWAPGEPKVIDGMVLTIDGWIRSPGDKTFNRYVPPHIDRIEGDVSKWLNHISAIYPGEADHIVRWLAHRVQRPGDKVNHALVFIGPQGIGKDTILKPAVTAIGSHNFKQITAKTFFNSEWNDYLQSVILRINEVHDLGGESRYGFYDATKDVITNPPEAHRINTKHVPQYAAVNVCGVIMTSNHIDALYLAPDDRRHFVCVSTRTQEDFTPAYWDDINGWFENGGNEAVAHYLANLDLRAFNAKAPPPKTAAWHMVVAAGVAPESGDLSDVIESMGKPDALTLQMVKARTPGDSQLRLLFEDAKLRRAIPKRLAECGYVAIANPEARDSGGRWRMPGCKTTIYARQALAEPDRLAAARVLSASAVAPPPIPLRQ
ncbi:bifunctional DNA primase/polymerase [Bradyrhizobium sp. 18BD]